MTREEAIQWLKVINTKESGWDEFALQESQRGIRERCEQGVREAIDMAIEALQREEAEEKGYGLRYLDKGLLMFLALSFPAPEEAPDDWFHHGDENLDAWRAYIMKCKERGYYDIPVDY